MSIALNRADFHPRTYRAKPVEPRFWSFVNTDGPILMEELGPCWVWTGNLLADGYGRLSINNRAHGAHRVSWVIHYGDLPADLWALHHCDNRMCVNPKHLYLGDHKANMADRVKRDGYERGEAHPSARLNPHAVRFIRRTTESHAELARIFNVDPYTIYAVRKRLTWAWVEDLPVVVGRQRV